MKLYTYYRSSAAYRVRITLNLKQIEYTSVPIHLAKQGHQTEEYLAVNPQGLIPTLDDDGFLLGQSLAIIEYLDETYQQFPLLPGNAQSRARIRAFSQAIVSEIHPILNLRVQKHLKSEMAQDDAAINQWYQHWIAVGFTALEQQISLVKSQFCCGDVITMADTCLVPQIYNAKRFKCDLGNYPNLIRINEELVKIPEFKHAAPENQADAEISQ